MLSVDTSYSSNISWQDCYYIYIPSFIFLLASALCTIHTLYTLFLTKKIKNIFKNVKSSRDGTPKSMQRQYSIILNTGSSSSRAFAMGIQYYTVITCSSKVCNQCLREFMSQTLIPDPTINNSFPCMFQFYKANCRKMWINREVQDR